MNDPGEIADYFRRKHGSSNQSPEPAGTTDQARAGKSPVGDSGGSGGHPPGDPPSLSPVSGFDANGRRVIRHEPGRLPEILDAVETAIATDTETNLFVHSGRLVRLYPAPVAETKGGIHRPKGTLHIQGVVPAHLCELAERAADHLKFDARKGDYRVIGFPGRVAEAYIARGNFSRIPLLYGFSESPVVTPRGRLIDHNGYDHETRLFFSIGEIEGYERPAGDLTRKDAKAATEILANAIRTFPFVDESDKTAAIAAILTAVNRRGMSAAPMAAWTAPSAGTGKSLGAETPSVIATGRRASVLSIGEDEKEFEKRLAGVLLEGDQSILLDNIETALGGVLICQALTQPTVRLRPLGTTAMATCPTSAFFSSTGNNLVIKGDLKRRTLLIRLDAQMERPEQRRFETDHLEETLRNRGKLLHAALVIPLVYLRAGAPAIDGLAPLGGFSDWDLLVRRPLCWLGMPDPLLASESLRDLDPDTDNMRQIFHAWQEAFGSEGRTAAEVVRAGLDSYPGSGDPVRPALRDALQLVCSEKPNPRRLGAWLKSHRNRILDGMQLVQAGVDPHSKVALWKLAGSAGSCGASSCPPTN